VGGDGWAYDIGSAGLDHVLASGRDVNVLVMDTEVYSNTGGQMSKSTPLGAVAKFAAGGKTLAKKDVALQAISYGNVYVARIAFGANPAAGAAGLARGRGLSGPVDHHRLQPLYRSRHRHGAGLPSTSRWWSPLVHWPLMRYNPVLRSAGQNPFVLDSPRPRMAFRDFAYQENRYLSLQKANPEVAEKLMVAAQEHVNLKWDTYEKMSRQSAAEFFPE
jgi:pyruvate-ferredoxin/flavodoxin oxidoreductase